MARARAVRALALALAALGAGCLQSPGGRCDTAADCAADERCDAGVCVRVPPPGGNGSGGGADPTTFTPVLWSTLQAAASASFSVDAVSADAATGDVVVAGALEGSYDPWAIGTGGFAARFTGAGARAWIVPLPTFSHGSLRTTAAPLGGVYFAGYAVDRTVIGALDVTPPARGALVLGRLDAAGAPVWARAVVNTHPTAPLAPAGLAARGSDLVVAGTGSGVFDPNAVGTDTAGHTFVAALDGADGHWLWSRGLGTRTVSDVEARDGGDVALAGVCTPAAASFDPGTGTTCAKGLFLVVLDGASGTPSWARFSTGSGAVSEVRDLAVAPGGGLAVVGVATGSVAFGGAAVSFGTSDASFAAFFGPTGIPGLVIRPVEAPTAPLPDAAAFSRGAFDPSGRFWISGRYLGQPTLGGLRFSACREPACGAAAFLARLETDGKVGTFLPIRAAPVAGAAFADDLVLAATTTGTVAHAQRFTGATSLGTTAAWSTSAAGLGVLRLAPPP